jgi:cobaltochelatase CobN
MECKERLRAVFISHDPNETLYLKEALAGLGPSGELFRASFYDCAALDASADSGGEEFRECAEKVKEADFICLLLHGGLPYFKSFYLLKDDILKVPLFFRSGIEDENAMMAGKSHIPDGVHAKLLAYRSAGGFENRRNFLLYLLKIFADAPVTPEEPQFTESDGLYLGPCGIDERIYVDAAARTPMPVVGVIVHFYNVRNGDLKHIDALVSALRREGAYPIPIYTNMVGERGRGLRSAMKKYFTRDGRVLPSAIIVTTGFALSLTSSPGRDFGGKSVFEEYGVPVFQALTTEYRYEKWRGALSGLDPMYLSSHVFQTEFDGQILSYVIGTAEEAETKCGIKRFYKPIEERVEKAARLAVNWASLAHKPYRDKRLAIIFHNMPPRVDMIGCAYGLDSPRTVYNMCERLAAKGFTFDYRFKDGREIIDKIIAGVTNDERYLSGDEALARSAAVMEGSRYDEIYSALPDGNKEDLEIWGPPPGELLTARGNVLIPGIINGNLFIGLQPPRAFTEKAEEAYHSTDITCPHQYVAFYKWLEEDFKADAAIHIGTHGTLEWLPGKEIALSEECWPDITISTLPHIYPYSINVPGEGAQAKRRSSAVILEHLIPPMTEGGVYGYLERLDGLIEQYYKVKQADAVKLPDIAAAIEDLCQREGLFKDAAITAEDFRRDTDASVEKIHMLTTEVKSMKIKDGLHRFGEPPEGERFGEMLKLLLSIRNGNVPSLREGACNAEGLDLDGILSNPAGTGDDGRTNAMALTRIDAKLSSLFKRWEERNFSSESIDGCIEAEFGKRNKMLADSMKFLCDEVAPRVRDTTDELDLFERAVEGKFVRPGPSGAPSRGNSLILPTGRNFYTIDPTTVPSRAAWKTGVRMAHGMLEKYERERGGLPESVAIVVYAGDTMKTSGDDLAEIMYLYGVRPVWAGESDRVCGIEPIPLEELGRPRIDVTLRISGLFRDTFPNLIERIEDAVNMVASLDERDCDNYIKKHITEDVAEMAARGTPPGLAAERAKIRVFGCPPSTYGAGADIMVGSKNWETQEDLGRAYINWSAHAYTKRCHGEKMEELFSRRMAGTDLTVKNVSSYETDMIDDDDYFAYHGGMISAIKASGGRKPLSLNTCCGDPEHIMTNNINEEMARIMRGRILNPKWIEGLKEHGFRGAQEFSMTLDIVFGWDATAEIAEDWMYDKIAETYLFDEELSDWIRENNRWAMHAMAERLLEAEARGMWNADRETTERIGAIFLDLDGDMEEA